MKRQIAWLMPLVLTLLLVFAAGCGRQKDTEKNEHISSEDEISIYYIDLEQNRLVEDYYKLQGTELSDQINEVLKQFSLADSIERMSPIGSSTRLLDYTVSKFYLKLKFDENYSKMDGATEILFRAALAKTLTQLDGIRNILIYVDNHPLMDRDGEEVGLINADSFIDHSDGTYNGEVILYYASVSGKNLRSCPVQIESTDGLSMEQLVIRQLIQGPDREGYRSAMPEGLDTVSVSVKDSICYVDFNDKFLKGRPDVNPEVTIYSLVNSLVELVGINKVQITVNGARIEMYQETVPVGGLLERNYDIVLAE